MDITPRYVSQKLAERAEEIARWLLPQGQQVGNDWCVGSVKGEEGKSCKVCLTGEKAGKWADFAQGETSGDLLDLIAAVRSCDLGAALKEACEYLGIERTTSWGSRKKEYAEPKRPEHAQAIAKAPAVQTWLAGRRISSETAAKYKLIADGDGVIVFPYFRDSKLLHLKFRSVREKKFWSSAGTEPCLFGWHALASGARAVILTEGEADALALAEYGLQAMSIPFGAGKGEKHAWIENEWEHLERFDTIFLATDMDGPGMKTTQELAERLGRHRVKAIKLPRKDANQCLMENVPREHIMRCVREAKSLDPPELRNSAEFTDEVIERYHPTSKDQNGFLLPWIEMHDKFVFGWGEVSVVAGYTNHGKSEIVGQIVLDAARQKVDCCVASLEFRPAKWLARNVRQVTLTEAPAVDQIRAAMEWLGNKMWVIDTTARTGSTSNTRLETILSMFEYAHRRYGIRLFVIDPFLKLGLGEDDFTAQSLAISSITDFATKHNVHVILIHHFRKAEDDAATHQLSTMSLRGAAAIGDLVDNVILAWRNKPKERKLRDPEFAKLAPEDQEAIRSKPDTILLWDKVREVKGTGDALPRLGLWFDKKSHQWQDQPGIPPVRYLKDLSVSS